MHSLEMLQRMNSAKVVDRERRRAILMNNPGGHPKSIEKYGIKGTRTARRTRKVLDPVESHPMSQEEIDNWERMNSR